MKLGCLTIESGRDLALLEARAAVRRGGQRVVVRQTMPGKDWLPAAVRAAAIDRKLKSGEALFRLGDKPAGLCEVLAGRVRMCRVDRSGREVILYVAGPGDCLLYTSPSPRDRTRSR